MKTTSYSAGTPEGFAFDTENEARAKTIVARYPAGRQASAVIGLLDMAQRQNGGWLSKHAIDYVAGYLEMAPIRVYEVASFYSMFYLRPVGKHLIQVCRTTPCWLRGSDEITKACQDKLGVGPGQISDDGLFSVVEVECLGACANAPMVQINDDYYEDLTAERMAQIVDDLRAGKKVPVGPQDGRLCSAPEGGPQTLRDVPKSGNGGAVKAAAGKKIDGDSLAETEKPKNLGSNRPVELRDKAADAQLKKDQAETATPKQDRPGKEDA